MNRHGYEHGDENERCAKQRCHETDEGLGDKEYLPCHSTMAPDAIVAAIIPQKDHGTANDARAREGQERGSRGCFDMGNEVQPGRIKEAFGDRQPLPKEGTSHS